jgi:hypothetical protein
MINNLYQNKFSDNEKIKYYQSRVKNQKLKPRQREYASKRLKQLTQNYDNKNINLKLLEENYFTRKDIVVNDFDNKLPKYLVRNPDAYDKLISFIKKNKEFQKNNYLSNYYKNLKYVDKNKADKLARKELKHTLNVDYYGLYFDYY